jgi:hypothetical protein
MRRRSTGDTMLRRGLVLALGATLVQTALHLFGVWELDARHPSLDAGSDHGLGAAAVVVASEVGALAALVACARARTRGDAVRLGFLACALGFLGVDRVAALHDRLAYGAAERAGLPHASAWATAVVYAPLLLPAAWILWFALPDGAGIPAARAGVIALGVALSFLPVALAVHLATGRLPETLREVGLAGKQGFELAGWVLVATALAATAESAAATRRRPAPA